MTQYTFEHTETLKLASDYGITYDIYINFPSASTAIAKKGFPVVYLLDGNATFPMAVTYARLGASAPRKNIQPTPHIIVGISAQDNSPFAKQRMCDFTPTAIPEKMPQKFAKMAITPERTGGIEQFINFLETKVKPTIANKYTINPDNQTLVGHSLGGLFTTYVLLNHRSLYQHYVIGSPSLWWNGGDLLAQSKRVTRGKETVKIVVGSKEPKLMQDRSQKLYQNLTQKLPQTNFKLCNDKNHLDMICETVFELFKN